MFLFLLLFAFGGCCNMVVLSFVCLVCAWCCVVCFVFNSVVLILLAVICFVEF